MNIFAVHSDPYLAAQSLHDCHVVKMILESAQLLSVAVQADDGLGDHFRRFLTLPNNDLELLGRLYKPTHANHPCAVWARQSPSNFAWLTCHLDGLVAEYHHRFQKLHATDPLRWIFCRFTAFLSDRPRFYVSGPSVSDEVRALASFAADLPLAMPDDCKDIRGFVQSYRNYYLSEKLFQQRVKWTRRGIPSWMLDSALDPATPARISSRLVELASANLEQAL